MSRNTHSRRGFLKNAALAAGGAILHARSAAGSRSTTDSGPHLACNQYPWLTYYRRDGRDFNASLEAGMADVARSGVDGFEPLATKPEDIDLLAPLLERHKIEMRSLYVNSVLHDPAQADQSIKTVLSIATKAKAVGTKIIVTNPSPIRWGGAEDKDDTQLKFQAKMLDELGAKLRAIGLLLSYHNHDIELKNAAREFHHMMLGTDPKHVTLCLDAHWIYRGSGDSAVAVFDIVKLYGRRITELHLRQSRDGIWSETLSEGDIDHPALAKQLLEIGVKPHLVLEQAVEEGSPKTMSPVEAHKQSLEYAKRVFADFA